MIWELFVKWGVPALCGLLSGALLAYLRKLRQEQKALDQQGSMVCVRYKVNATGAYKVGWVDYAKGVQ